MAYREVTMIEVKEILRQWLSGHSLKATARWTATDRNTIRRYIPVAQACGLRVEEGADALTVHEIQLMLALAEAEGLAETLHVAPYRDRNPDRIRPRKIESR